MTTPHAELKRLAERCATVDLWYREGDLRGRQTFGQFLPQDRAFIAAASPQTLLSLIEENERMREALREVESEAHRYAGFYPQSSDGRNTFVMFADMVASKALRSQQKGER